MATTYVDQITGSGETVAYKAPCRVATTANIALDGLQTIDGVALAADDRVLVKSQTDQKQNGIYIASTGLWMRARDMDSNRDITKGTQVLVTGGTLLADSAWKISSDLPISVGTSNITFTASAVVNGDQVKAIALEKLENLGDLDDVPEARANLGLGTAALVNVETFAPAVRGLPAGGLLGQALIKSSEDNYDTEWSPSIPGGGDMIASAYDPQGKGTDAFDMDSMSDGSSKVAMTVEERDRVAATGNLVSSVAALRTYTGTAATVSTLGYTAPFEAQNGGAIYDYDASDTTTADDGILTIVDGAARRWKQRISGALNALTAGLKTTGNMNAVMIAAIAAAALLPGKALAIPAGAYTLTTHVDFSALDRVDLQGDVTFDFSTATVATSFTTNGSFVYVGGAAVIALPLLNADIAKGDTTVPFVSAHGLAVGDVFCPYDTVDGSYQGGRADYRKGEWLHVAEVTSSTSVKTRETICDSYAAATNTPGKHPGKKFRISGGKLNIIEATGSAFNSIAGVKLARLLDGDYSAVRPTNSNYAAMILEMCVGVFGADYKLVQPNVGAGGLQYGIVFSGTQDVDIQGDFYGYRHAVTTGGSTGIGFVVNRHIYVSGVARNAPDAAIGIAAVNTHGNTNDFRFVGLLDGGYSGGGNKIHCEGEFIGKPSQTGVVILLVEMSGCDYKFRGKVFTPGDAATVTRGVVDMGGNAVNSLNADTFKGGTLDFDGLDINAPIGRTGIRLVNRGYVGTEKVKISIKGTRMRPSTGTTPVLLQTSIVSGNNFDEMHCDGVQNDNDGWSITAGSIVAICGWRAAGTATVTPASTAVNNASQAITFSRKAPRTPIVLATPKTNLIGGKRYTTAVVSPTATGATLQALTADSANFGSTTPGDLSWLAVVQDL